MPIISASEATDKHAKRTVGAVEDYKAGVARVDESPTAKAAAAEDKWAAGVEKARQSGKFKAGLNRVSLEEWKSKTIKKGAGRIAAGVEEAKPKPRAFFEEYLPYQVALQSKLASMSDNTLEDSIARATEAIRHNAAFVRKS